LLDQFAPGYSQQGGGSEVGLLDQPLLADGAIAHRGQVKDVETALPNHVQFSLHFVGKQNKFIGCLRLVPLQ
jgi:hypothetical protein